MSLYQDSKYFEANRAAMPRWKNDTDFLIKNYLMHSFKNHPHYNTFYSDLSSKTIIQLVGLYNRETHKNTWVSARGYFLAALKTVFKEKKVDLTKLLNYEDGLQQFSLKYPVYLDVKKNQLVPIK